jgi:hypothetical protein
MSRGGLTTVCILPFGIELGLMNAQDLEILSIIFQSCPVSTTAICARVCRAWSEPALDASWREVKDIRHLLNLLPPFYEDRVRAAPRLTLGLANCRVIFSLNVVWLPLIGSASCSTQGAFGPSSIAIAE